jgi:hypothetical protein
VPENECDCKIEIEFIDISTQTLLYGDSFDLQVKAADYLIIPYPLNPVQVKESCSSKSNKLAQC